MAYISLGKLQVGGAFPIRAMWKKNVWFKIVGIRLFKESKASDTEEAKAFKFERNLIDIYSNSWGPVDNGFFIRGPGRKAKKALQDGVRKVKIVLSIINLWN